MPKLVIAVGGTGQQVALTLSHLVYLKAVPEDFELRVVDADERGGVIHRLSGFEGFCDKDSKPQLYPHPLRWSGELLPPYAVGAMNQAQDRTFKALMEINPQSPVDDRAAFDALFTADDARLDVANGFYGRPLIGATSFAAQGGDMTNRLRAEVANAEQVFFTGSLIGGTGAGVLPAMIGQLSRSTEQRAKTFAALIVNHLSSNANAADQIRPEQMDDNFRHGIKYFYDHVKPRLKATALMGPPAQHTALTQARPYAEAQRSIFPLLACRAIFEMASNTTEPWNGAVLAWGHDADKEQSLVNETWDRGVSLAERLRRADSTLAVLRELLDAKNRLGSELGFWGFDSALPKALRSIRGYGRAAELSTSRFVDLLFADLDRRRQALEASLTAVRQVFKDAGAQRDDAVRSGHVLHRLKRIWSDPPPSAPEGKFSPEERVATLGQRLFDSLLDSDAPRI